MKAWFYVSMCVMSLLLREVAYAQERRIEQLNVAYDGFTASRAPLWIAKDMGLFEKYGLDVRLVVTSVITINALIGGDIDIASAVSSTAIRLTTRVGLLVPGLALRLEFF